MTQQGHNDTIPSLMLIMRTVAKAAGLTTADLMEGNRKAELCNARAAVYKIAAEYGYPKEEIMYFLDRNRTAAYNYEINLKGPLLRDTRFKALCGRVSELLSNLPHRAAKSRQSAPQRPKTAIVGVSRQNKPTFTDWKGRLGWTFTAEECRRMWHAMRAAKTWFDKTYCSPPATPPRPVPIDPSRRRIPTEMNTAQASTYLGVSAAILVRGARIGQLRRFKKPGDTSYWYYTAELDRFKIYLGQKRT